MSSKESKKVKPKKLQIPQIYQCSCFKKYNSYSGLYLHAKEKHSWRISKHYCRHRFKLVQKYKNYFKLQNILSMKRINFPVQGQKIQNKSKIIPNNSQKDIQFNQNEHQNRLKQLNNQYEQVILSKNPLCPEININQIPIIRFFYPWGNSNLNLAQNYHFFYPQNYNFFNTDRSFLNYSIRDNFNINSMELDNNNFNQYCQFDPQINAYCQINTNPNQSTVNANQLSLEELNVLYQRQLAKNNLSFNLEMNK